MTHWRISAAVTAALIALLMTAVIVAQVAPIEQQVLVWLEAGFNPAESSPATAGQIGLLDSTGEFTALLDVPAQASRITPCDTAADGSRFAFFVGNDTGTLYQMTGQETPTVIADALDAHVCTGWNGFRYSPDGSRLAYLAYEADARQSEFADGTLHIIDSDDLSSEFRADKVVAFDVNNTGVAFVSFLVNNRSEADEAVVFWWEDGREREIIPLTPDEGCHYTSASVGIAPDNHLVLVLGHRCRSGDTRTSWQVHSVDTTTSSAIMAAPDFQAGQFASYARTNNVIFSPAGDTVYFTVPDGVTTNTVGIRSFTLSDMSTASVIEQQAVMATFGASANAAPQLSPDGRWLAVVITSPDSENRVSVIDLTDAGATPFTYSPNSRDDTITALCFSPDSSALYIISGVGDTRSGEYKLTSLNFADDRTTTLRRGRFAPALVVNDESVILLEYQTLDDPQQPPYLNLIALNPTSNETITLLEGATIADNRVTEQRFAYPLTWR